MLLGVWLLPAASARAVTIDPQARTVQAARLSMAFGGVGPDVVSSLQWTNSTGTQGANLVLNNGQATCENTPDPLSFWGQSYGDGATGTNPDLVLAGSKGTWTSPAANEVRTSTEYPTACSGYAAAVPVTTTYTYYDTEPQANEIAVTRTWSFDLAQPPTTGATGLRAYVPQLPLKQYAQILYPSGGRLQAHDMTPTECTTGTAACLRELGGDWFAINDATGGSGVLVLRDASDAPGAELAIQGSYSGAATPAAVSNLTSIDLPIPAGGLIAPIAETEYLCFYDATSWPQSAREALQLPAGCGPVAPPVGPTTPTGPGTAPAEAKPAGRGGAGPIPPPVLAHSFNLEPAGGEVLVRPPGGGGFIPLTEAAQIPLGTIIDATHGSVRLTSARDAHGHTEIGLFYGGVFRVTQVRARSGVHGGHTVVLTVLTLVGPLPRCRAKHASVSLGHGHGGATARVSGHGGVRKLWGNAKGNYRTVGHYASATVRGTKWLTEDTCTATLVRVARGVVSVNDFPHHRTLLLHAPHGFRSHPGKGG